MTIRKATLNDFEDIIRLNHDLFLYEKKFSQSYNENWPQQDAGREYFAKRIVHSKAIVMVAEEEKEGADAGEILFVKRKGYILHDRLLRAAAVIVAKGGEQSAEEGAENEGGAE